MTTVPTAGFAMGVRLTRLSLRLAGFRRTITILDCFPKPPKARAASTADVDRWTNTIRRVGRRPYGATCLDRSVFLWFLMRQHGLDGRIRIGVAFDEGRLDGHAWVELDGVVVNESPTVADHFAVFDEDPTGIVFS